MNAIIVIQKTSCIGVTVMSLLHRLTLVEVMKIHIQEGLEIGLVIRDNDKTRN